MVFSLWIRGRMVVWKVAWVGFVRRGLFRLLLDKAMVSCVRVRRVVGVCVNASGGCGGMRKGGEAILEGWSVGW